MISDLDVIRACRDAQACMTPPSSLEAIMRRYGVTAQEAMDGIAEALDRGLIDGHTFDTARPTEAGLRLLRESENEA